MLLVKTWIYCCWSTLCFLVWDFEIFGLASAIRKTLVRTQHLPDLTISLKKKCPNNISDSLDTSPKNTYVFTHDASKQNISTSHNGRPWGSWLCLPWISSSVMEMLRRREIIWAALLWETCLGLGESRKPLWMLLEWFEHQRKHWLEIWNGKIWKTKRDLSLVHSRVPYLVAQMPQLPLFMIFDGFFLVVPDSFPAFGLLIHWVLVGATDSDIQSHPKTSTLRRHQKWMLCPQSYWNRLTNELSKLELEGSKLTVRPLKSYLPKRKVMWTSD